MFNIGFSELMLIGLVALVVIGPEKLPAVARAAGRWVGRMQRFVAGVKADLAQDFNLDELRQMKSEFEAQAVQMRAQMAGVQSRLESLRMAGQTAPAGSGSHSLDGADALAHAGRPFSDDWSFPGDLPIDVEPEGDAHLQLELPLPPPPPMPAMESDGQLLLDLAPAEPLSGPEAPLAAALSPERFPAAATASAPPDLPEVKLP